MKTISLTLLLLAPGLCALAQQAQDSPAGSKFNKHYRWLSMDLGVICAQKVEVKQTSDDNTSLKVDGADGQLPAIGGKLMADLRNSRDIRIRIDERFGKTTYAGLTFTNPCVLAILGDGTLVADREDIYAFDKERAQYRSAKDVSGGKEHFVFVPVKASSAAPPKKQDGWKFWFPEPPTFLQNNEHAYRSDQRVR